MRIQVYMQAISDKICIIISGEAPLMGKIEFTNLIIDDFQIARRQTDRIFTHILTHIHTDHLKGLADGWNYGPIYCTQVTKSLLLQKYPNITCIHAVELQTPIVLKMSPSLELTATFFDANHCAGSAIVLLEGYIGTVLYTGDFRFDAEVFKNYNLLYPPQNLNSTFTGCSKHVDLLYVDNTFLKQKFQFPKRSEVLKDTMRFIRELMELNIHTRIYVALDNYGKEEVLEYIAKELDVYIVVSEQRYEVLQAMGRDIELYTTDTKEGFIEVISKRQIKQYLQNDKESICFIFSGWVNQASYRFGRQIYCFPYSLHSNYQEIHDFVNSIRPSYIEPIVFSYPEEDRIFYAGKTVNLLQDQSNSAKGGNYANELQELRAKYCSPVTEEYRRLMTDSQFQKMIHQMLMPPRMLEFQQDKKDILPVHLQVVERKKYKLKNERNETEINRLRNQIQLKRKLIEGERIEVIDDQTGHQQQPNEIIIEESQDDAIPIDLQVDEFQIDGPNLMDVDPYNTNKYSKTLISQKPKKTGALPRNQSVKPFNKEAQERFLEKVRRKLEEQKGPKYVTSLFSQRDKEGEKAAQQKRESMEFKPAQRKQIMVEQTLKKSSNVSWLSQVDMDKVVKMKVIKNKSEVQDFFKRNKEDFDFVMEEIKKKKMEQEWAL